MDLPGHHAVALNVIRLGEWWLGTPRAKTRSSPFAALRVTAAESHLAQEFATSIKVSFPLVGS
jgi:hypothetical protein